MRRENRALWITLALSIIGNVTLATFLFRSIYLDPSKPRNLTLAAMAELTADAPSTGRSNAPVTIVIFSDFECPYCRGFASALTEIEPHERDRFKLVFRHFPLPMHPFARGVAELSACVAMQSNSAFWYLYDYLFTQTDLGEDPMPGAMRLMESRPDIKMPVLSACVNEHQAADVVDHDLSLGKKYGVRGTPTIFVNGTRFNGALDADQLAREIDRIAGVHQPIPLSP